MTVPTRADRIGGHGNGDQGGRMTTAVSPQARTAANAEAAEAPHPADVFVIFGITGDLAKVMTFRSLYRLERARAADCPIVGVAVDDWTDRRPARRTRARAIEGTGEPVDDEVFDRFAARLSYVHGDFADGGDLRAGGGGDQGRRAAGLLPRDPAVPVRHRRQGPGRRRA